MRRKQAAGTRACWRGNGNTLEAVNVCSRWLSPKSESERLGGCPRAESGGNAGERHVASRWQERNISGAMHSSYDLDQMLAMRRCQIDLRGKREPNAIKKSK